MTEESKVDYLEVDDPIPGQNYCCLSFISPEDLIESKEGWKVSKFLQSVCKDKDMEFKKILEQYKDFCYKFQDELQRDFDQNNDFKTNIRGLKMRGVYNTKEEATNRAKKLQSIDSDFHVFVGQVGYWLPWDPCADKIEDEQYINSQLNEMMEKYKENTINKDIFYEEQKRKKVKAAREEALRKKKEKENEGNNDVEENIPDDKEKNKDVEENIPDDKEKNKNVEENTPDDKEENKDVEENTPDKEKNKDVEENISDKGQGIEQINEIIGDDKVDDELKESMEAIDPWIANKMKEQ